MSAPTPRITGTSQETENGQSSVQGTGREVLGDTALSQRSESGRTRPAGYTAR